MPVPPVIASGLLAYHSTHKGGGDLAILFVFLGVLGTAAWLIFSELRWAHTVMVTVAGWVALVALMVVL